MEKNRVDYKIYQIGYNDGKYEKIKGKIFRDFEGDILNMDIYEKTYEGTLKANNNTSNKNLDFNILEDLFVKFNINYSKNFKGRSLSVSDVVKLNDAYYYCQSSGWKKIEVNN